MEGEHIPAPLGPSVGPYLPVICSIQAFIIIIFLDLFYFDYKETGNSIGILK